MSRERLETVAVAIFAKAPVAGFAKTRLIPRLGERGAADLQRKLIERAVRVAVEAGLGPISLWCLPNRDHEVFTTLERRHHVELQDQLKDADLGARMHHAFVTLAQTRPVLLMGTDCVALTPRHLERSAELLCGHVGAVIIPVEDGGYILIGLKRPSFELFADMPWGHANVMARTRAKAKEAGLTLAELPPLWDIDRVADYERAASDGLI